MQIHYVTANPSGNITLFVLDPIPPEQRKVVNRFLLEMEPTAEQVGCFAVAGNHTTVTMMGGEFCGNASRSSAAYALLLQNKDQGDFMVSCSGCSEALPARAKKIKDRTYETVIKLQPPLKTGTIPLSYERESVECQLISLPGIDHYIYFTPNLDYVDKEQLFQSLQREVSRWAEPDAYGLMLVDPGSLEVIPAVYVCKTGTLYWENSCGSGAASVAAALALRQGRSLEVELTMPGGKLTAGADIQDGKVVSLHLGGLVEFGEEKTAELK